MKKINNHKINNDEVDKLIDLICSSPLNYKHLQVFLHRKTESDCRSYEFLMITPTSFGKIELLDINVEENIVILNILDCATKIVGDVRIDISDEKPSVLFIHWNDIIGMTKKFNKDIGNDNVLEFEF